MIANTKLNSSSQIKRGAIISYATIMFNIVAGLIYTPWLISKIGPSDYGIFTLSVSVIGLFVMDFGLGAAVSKFMSKYIAQNKLDKMNDFLGITFKLYVIVDLIIFIVLMCVFISINDIYKELTPTEIHKFKTVFCISGLFSIVSFPFIPLNGILIANEKFVFIKFCELFNKIGTIILMVIAIFMGRGLYAIVIVNVFVGSILILLKLKYMKVNTNLKVNFKCKDKVMLKEIFNFSIWTTIMNIAGRIIMNITPTILAISSGSGEIAIFSIGMTIEGYTYTFASGLNGLFLPKVSKILDDKTRKNEIEKLMVKVGRIQLFIIGIILIGFMVFGKEFISMWMGPKFDNAYWVALFLIIPCFITLTQEIANTMIIVVDKVKERSIIHVFTAILSIILSLILSKKYGAIGSALAIGIATFIGNVIVVNIFYCYKLNINIKKFFIDCHLKMIIPLLLSYTVGILLNKFIYLSGWVFFALKVVIMICVYVILMWNVALNEEEKGLIVNVSKRIKNR